MLQATKFASETTMFTPFVGPGAVDSRCSTNQTMSRRSSSRNSYVTVCLLESQQQSRLDIAGKQSTSDFLIKYNEIIAYRLGHHIRGESFDSLWRCAHFVSSTPHHCLLSALSGAAAGREMRAKANEPQTDIERP